MALRRGSATTAQDVIHETNTVACFSSQLDDLALWDGNPCGWENVRWTAVLERRKNDLTG